MTESHPYQHSGLNVFLTPRRRLLISRRRPRLLSSGQSTMNDLCFVLLTLGFFALSAAYAVFCERVR